MPDRPGSPQDPASASPARWTCRSGSGSPTTRSSPADHGRRGNQSPRLGPRLRTGRAGAHADKALREPRRGHAPCEPSPGKILHGRREMTRLIRALGVLGTVAVVVAGCGSLTDSLVQAVNDTTLTTEIKTEIAKTEGMSTLTHIGVKTDEDQSSEDR